MEKDKKKSLSKLADTKYKYGFISDIDSEDFPIGLNEDIIRLISKKKAEPSWLLDFRLKAFRHWQKMKEPTWAKVNYS